MRLSAMAAFLTVVAACAAPPSRAELTTLDDLAQLPEAAVAEAANARDGVVVGLHFDEPGARYDGFLWEAANAGADSISLVWSWQQVDVRASEVERRSSDTPADTVIVEAAQLAPHVLAHDLPVVLADDLAALAGIPAQNAIVERETGPRTYEALERGAALPMRSGMHFLVTRKFVMGG